MVLLAAFLTQVGALQTAPILIAVVTAFLTILGFSLYDTVVVFDKIKENTHQMRQTRQTYAYAANLAVNQTLVRSINTSIVAFEVLKTGNVGVAGSTGTSGTSDEVTVAKS